MFFTENVVEFVNCFTPLHRNYHQATPSFVKGRTTQLLTNYRFMAQNENGIASNNSFFLHLTAAIY